ncbi:MAG: hypothetical protein ACOH2F_11085 [Cellulomonas sp.]
MQILGAWQDGRAAACVVYRRTIDPMKTLGRRLEFPAQAADGTVEGFARDVAINLAEPIGIARSGQDQHGIVWVAVRDDRPTPELPVEVVRMLAERWSRPSLVLGMKQQPLEHRGRVLGPEDGHERRSLTTHSWNPSPIDA